MTNSIITISNSAVDSNSIICICIFGYRHRHSVFEVDWNVQYLEVPWYCLISSLVLSLNLFGVVGVTFFSLTLHWSYFSLASSSDVCQCWGIYSLHSPSFLFVFVSPFFMRQIIIYFKASCCFMTLMLCATLFCHYQVVLWERIQNRESKNDLIIKMESTHVVIQTWWHFYR